MVSYNDGLEQSRVFLRENRNRLMPNDWILIAEQSRQHFSRDKPQALVFDITGNGTGIYTLTGVATNWANKFSSITQLEYPSGQPTPIYVDRNTYAMYRPSNTLEQLKFFSMSPTASETIRLSYSAPHVFAANSTSTIDDLDKMLIGLLLAAYAALALSADFLKANRSNIQNDSVDFSQKSKDMSDLSDDLFKRYATMISGKTDGAKSYANAVKDFDMRTSFGDEFLIHDESTR